MQDEYLSFDPMGIILDVKKVLEEVKITFRSRMDYESDDPFVYTKIGPLYPWRLKLAEMLHASIWEGRLSKFSKTATNNLVIRENTLPLWEKWDRVVKTWTGEVDSRHRIAASGLEAWHDSPDERHPRASWHIGGERQFAFLHAGHAGWKFKGGVPLLPGADQTAGRNVYHYARWSELEVGEQFDLRIEPFAKNSKVFPRSWRRLAERWNNLTGWHYEIDSRGETALFVQRLPDSALEYEKVQASATYLFTRDVESGDQGCSTPEPG